MLKHPQAALGYLDVTLLTTVGAKQILGEGCNFLVAIRHVAVADIASTAFSSWSFKTLSPINSEDLDSRGHLAETA